MLKTQEFRTKDFVARWAHSIEHQKCKYCVGRQGVRASSRHIATLRIRWTQRRKKDLRKAVL